MRLIASIWAVSLIASAWIGEGRAAAQTTRGPSPGVLMTGGQDSAPDTVPSETGLVQVEVVVTDDHHNPVTGIPAEAFHLEEGGKRQRVVSFLAVDLSESAAFEPPRISTNAVGAIAPPQPRAFVVVFDDLHLTPAGALQAREATEAFIMEHTRPGDEVTLVAPGEGLVSSVTMPDGRAPLAALMSSLSGRREVAAVLTDYDSFRIVEAGDSALEKRALERFRDAGTLPSSGQNEYVRSEARQVLERARSRRRQLLSALAAALDVLPSAGTRKSVLLVSEGFIYEPGDPLTYGVIVASQRAGAAVHFLDARGLAAGSRPDRSRSALGKDSTGAEILATITGGYSVQNVKDLAEALGGLSREASHHYLLGYHPQGERGGGQLRRLQVEVARPNAVVWARKAYYDAPGTSRDPERVTSALDTQLRDALRSPSLIRDIPLRLTALVLAPADDGRVHVTIASEASAKGVKLEQTPEGSVGATLDLVLAITHVQPQASQVVSLEGLAVTVPGGARVKDAWLPFQRSFQLPPGRCQVKLVVRDRRSGAIGTVVHQLEVPAAAEFRISSPILSDMPGGEGVQPPRIVARRSFVPGSVLYCYFEIFPGPGISSQMPTTAASAYEIVDSRGKVRHRAALPLAVRRDDGGLGRLIEVPLARNEPGEYELVVKFAGETAGGTAELREPFSVTKPRRFSDDLYRGALSAYLDGDFESAVTTLLQWPAKDVGAAAARLPQSDDGLRDTALLLHTDLALVLKRHGKVDGAQTHLAIARALLEGAPLRDRQREWLLALAYTYQASLRPAEALAFYIECAKAFPEAGEASLGAGTLYEHNAFLPDGFGRGNLHLPPPIAAEAAERSYVEALLIQPSLTEARLRLGRVFQMTDRLDEAVLQLSLVVDSSQDASLSALAHLFWGQISETLDDEDEALEQYRAALAADPDLQVAALALAQILHRRVGRQAAVDVLVPALDERRRNSWLAYIQGPQGLSTSTLHELRSRLHVQAGDTQ